MNFLALALACAPSVHPSTLEAIARVESSMNPLAIHVNGARLARQPRDKLEAIAWASWLIDRGHSVDLGLMQINSRNLAALGLTATTAFEPCDNLRAAAKHLVDDFDRARAAQKTEAHALGIALSRFNTGNPTRGFENGYVDRVLQAANR
jgi:type IV secretion system protein VirB1